MTSTGLNRAHVAGKNLNSFVADSTARHSSLLVTPCFRLNYFFGGQMVYFLLDLLFQASYY